MSGPFCKVKSALLHKSTVQSLKAPFICGQEQRSSPAEHSTAMFGEKVSRQRLRKKFVYYKPTTNQLTSRPVHQSTTSSPFHQSTTKLDHKMNHAEGTSTENVVQLLLPGSSPLLPLPRHPTSQLYNLKQLPLVRNTHYDQWSGTPRC